MPASLDLHKLVEIAQQYWLLPVGMTIIYFFARYHFNTPDYALIGRTLPDTTTADLPKASPQARLRSSAPPIFTTPRDRYRRSEIKYVLGLELAYLCLTLFPDLLNALPALQGSEALQTFLAKSFADRAVVGALLLTGFLSSFPLVRDFDNWLLTALHRSASIPDDAEQTADELFDVGYRRDDTILRKMLEGVRAGHLLAVANGTATGALEERWLNVRCLTENLKAVLTDDSDRCHVFKGKFYREFQDITVCIMRLRPRVVELMTAQNSVIPQEGSVEIDTWISDHSAEPGVGKLQLERDKLLFEIDALFYRLCLFTSLVVYATEQNLHQINGALSKIGFPVKISIPPRNPWDAVLIAGAATLVVCLIPTIIYTLIVQAWHFEVQAFQANVPSEVREAGLWALLACLIHTSAAMVATLRTVREIKVRHANGVDLSTDHITRNTVVALQGSIIPAIILILYGLLPGQNLINTISWIFIPFITAFFTAAYARSFFDGRSLPFVTPAVQAASMAIVALLLSVILVPPNPDFGTWPPVVYVFIVYAVLTAGVIGLTLGSVFKRFLSTNVHRLPSSGERPSSTGLAFASDFGIATALDRG